MKYLSVLLVGLSLLAIGCDQRDKTTTTTTTPSSTTTTTMTTDTSDASLTTKIRKSILDDTSLSSQAKSVTVNVVNRVATLKGTVNTDSEKDKVDSIVKNTQGVERVDNQIDVKKQ